MKSWRWATTTFQKKCMGKMHDVATGTGRTILFVSHNLGALSQLCKRGVLLENGTVKTIGPIEDVIKTYLNSGLRQDTGHVRFPTDLAKPCQFVSAEILHSDGSPRIRFQLRRAGDDPSHAGGTPENGRYVLDVAASKTSKGLVSSSPISVIPTHRPFPGLA